MRNIGNLTHFRFLEALFLLEKSELVPTDGQTGCHFDLIRLIISIDVLEFALFFFIVFLVLMGAMLTFLRKIDL